MPIAATDPVTPDNLGITFHVDTGTLYVGNQAVTGFATRDMIEPTVYATTETLDDRIQAVEKELDRLKHLFTAEFTREIVERCEQFVSDREFCGMTDEEFSQSLQELLYIQTQPVSTVKTGGCALHTTHTTHIISRSVVTRPASSRRNIPLLKRRFNR